MKGYHDSKKAKGKNTSNGRCLNMVREVPQQVTSIPQRSIENFRLVALFVSLERRCLSAPDGFCAQVKGKGARDLEVDVKPPEPRGVRPNSPQSGR